MCPRLWGDRKEQERYGEDDHRHCMKSGPACLNHVHLMRRQLCRLGYLMRNAPARKVPNPGVSTISPDGGISQMGIFLPSNSIIL
jgi:hypothetical protein